MGLIRQRSGAADSGRADSFGGSAGARDRNAKVRVDARCLCTAPRAPCGLVRTRSRARLLQAQDACVRSHCTLSRARPRSLAPASVSRIAPIVARASDALPRSSICTPHCPSCCLAAHMRRLPRQPIPLRPQRRVRVLCSSALSGLSSVPVSTCGRSSGSPKKIRRLRPPAQRVPWVPAADAPPITQLLISGDYRLRSAPRTAQRLPVVGERRP